MYELQQKATLTTQIQKQRAAFCLWQCCESAANKMPSTEQTSLTQLAILAKRDLNSPTPITILSWYIKTSWQSSPAEKSKQTDTEKLNRIISLVYLEYLATRRDKV